MSSKDEKEEENQEHFQNVEHESGNEQLDILEIENSKNSDKDEFTEERLPPQPPLDQPSTSGSSRTRKNMIECRDQFTMRKNDHAYFVTDEREPRDVGSNFWKITKF